MVNLGRKMNDIRNRGSILQYFSKRVFSVRNFFINQPVLLLLFLLNKINLFIASYEGNEGIVKLLIDANADVDIKNKDGKTALHRG